MGVKKEWGMKFVQEIYKSACDKSSAEDWYPGKTGLLDLSEVTEDIRQIGIGPK